MPRLKSEGSSRVQPVSSRVMITYEEARRVDAFVMRVGKMKASGLLGVGDGTVEIACEQGRMMRKTRDRLFAALDAIEGGQ